MPLVHGTTNKINQPLNGAFLRARYSLTEEYAENHPEDFAKALLLAERFEKASQAMTRLEQAEEKLSNGITRLEEDNKILLAQQTDLIESSEKNTQALENLAKSSSEMREITSNIANAVSNCANKIFNPVRNRFYFLTRQTHPAEVLPRENQLAIEDNPANTISNTDPTNPSSVDEKKNPADLLKFCMGVVGLYVLYSNVQRIFWCSSVKE